MRVNRALGAVSQRLGREASLAEAATAASVDVADARRALQTHYTTTPLAELEAHASAAADEAIDACEVRAFVQAGLEQLGAQEREAVKLRFEADLQQAEIGRRLHISQSQASRLLATALAKLRRELAPDWDQAA